MSSKQPSPPPPSSPLFLQVTVLILMLVLPYCLASSTGSTSSSSRFTNYAPYQYDQTTPMFTPDGRLLQVEYASLAATHSSPLLIFSTKTSNSCTMANKKNDNCLVLMAHHPQKRKRRTGQDRLILLSSSSPYPSSLFHNNDVVVGISGIVGDSVALLQQIQKKYEENLRLYNFQHLHFHDVITALSDATQRHSFGGGIRPYGSQMIVCTSSGDDFQIATVDPSGAIHKMSLTDNDHHHPTTRTTTVDTTRNSIRLVGGTKVIQDQIRKDLETQNFFSSFGEEGGLQKSLRIACRTMCTILGKNDKDNNTGKQEDTATATTAAANNDDDDEHDSWLEVVIISQSKGAYRLTDRQVEALLNSLSSSS